LIAFLQMQVAQGFVKANQASLLLHERTASSLLDSLQSFVPQQSSKLLDALAAQRLLK
jgi:hypothetical protein